MDEDGQPRLARRWPSAIEALRYRDYPAVWSGLFFAYVGTWMQTYVIGWYVVQLAIEQGERQRGPLYVGLVGISRGGPLLLAGFLAGTIPIAWIAVGCSCASNSSPAP